MRLHSEDRSIREHLLEGRAGLELESHRVDERGYLAQTPHPFADRPYIDRDFSEEQIEINTPPRLHPEEALQFLHDQLSIVHGTLKGQKELLWPFSNPPVIRKEEDIPVARYEGDQEASYRYRLYLAERYGRYKMTYSGIHFNYSFCEELLRYNRELERRAGTCVPEGYEDYRDLFYLQLGEKALCYSWAVVALLAASPVADNSFFERGKSGETLFTGLSSLRCSEFGYWNFFTPILSYRSVEEYADSIDAYIRQGLLTHARELYYPVRVKPPGKYTLEALRERGIDHIELRQIDLNPFCPEGIDIRDMEFLGLLLDWLASKEMEPLTDFAQTQALQNHKNAAAYDWDVARITLPHRKAASLRHCLSELIGEMKAFYQDVEEASEPLAHQEAKIRQEENRYAVQVRRLFGKDYAGEGLRRARQIQESYL